MKHYVYGNGESRKGFGVGRFDGVSWGCNAIHRDTEVDNLVVVDYGMQGEVLQSGYAKYNRCWFSDWELIPSEMKSEFSKNFDKEQIYEFGTDKGVCVINGKQRPKDWFKINDADKRERLLKESGLYIIYPSEDDKIQSIEDPKEWSAGSTAVHLACQNRAEEVYMFGFDLSTYNDNINNIYKGSKNYLPETAKGFNAANWRSQLYITFNEYSKVKFKWVGNDFRYINNSKIMDCKNVELLTYDNIGDIR